MAEGEFKIVNRSKNTAVPVCLEEQNRSKQNGNTCALTEKNAGVAISGLKNQDKTAAAAGSAELSFLAKDIL